MSIILNPSSRKALYEEYKAQDSQLAKEFRGGERYRSAQDLSESAMGFFLVGSLCALVAFVIAALSSIPLPLTAAAGAIFVASVLIGGLLKGSGYLMKRSILAEVLSVEEIQKIAKKFITASESNTNKQ